MNKWFKDVKKDSEGKVIEFTILREHRGTGEFYEKETDKCCVLGSLILATGHPMDDILSIQDYQDKRIIELKEQLNEFFTFSSDGLFVFTNAGREVYGTNDDLNKGHDEIEQELIAIFQYHGIKINFE